jgi:hypothetical protein
MRTRLLLFVCLALSAQSPQPPPTPTKAVQKIKQTSGGESQESENGKNGAEKAPTSAEQLQPAQRDGKTQNSSKKPGDPTPDQWVAWFTGALAVIAVLQFGAMAFQACYMRKGLRIAIETAQAAKNNAKAASEAAETAKNQSLVLVNSERAWVVPTDIEPPNIHTAPGVGGDVFNSFTFDLINRGKTVARLTGPYKARFCMLPRSVRLDDTPDYGGMGASGDAPNYGRVLAPGERNGVTSISLPDPVDGDKLIEIEEERLLLYAYVSLVYYDSFGKERELQFGYLYQPKRTGSAPKWVRIRKPEYNKHT